MRCNNAVARALILLFALSIAAPLYAHHSMLLYDKTQMTTIEGVVSSAFFGLPHSRYEIEVERDGEVEVWTMIAQDPDDARRFGYYEELQRLVTGSDIEIKGWPHRLKNNELLGHQMRSSVTGIVELIPLSGYVRPSLYAAMDRAVADERVLDMVAADVDDEMLADKLLRWISGDHPVARAGVEVQKNRAAFIALGEAANADYVDMPKYLSCQTELRDTVFVNLDDAAEWPDEQQQRLRLWVGTYNRVLAKHWELTLSSCGN